MVLPGKLHWPLISWLLVAPGGELRFVPVGQQLAQVAGVVLGATVELGVELGAVSPHPGNGCWAAPGNGSAGGPLSLLSPGKMSWLRTVVADLCSSVGVGGCVIGCSSCVGGQHAISCCLIRESFWLWDPGNLIKYMDFSHLMLACICGMSPQLPHVPAEMSMVCRATLRPPGGPSGAPGGARYDASWCGTGAPANSMTSCQVEIMMIFQHSAGASGAKWRLVEQSGS